ncbi:MAG TPA: N-acetylmuramoyl-L-alanine amidase [Thermoanaerobaculia bacterium]|nr:N-acetylmuramoyl-L-alanine amidase [Thermoanaerobaculia bacterium]
MDPSRTGTSISVRQRRDLLKAAVRENVYIKAGKRPPLGRPRSWARWTMLTLALPGVAAGALLLLPGNRTTAPDTAAPEGVASTAADKSAGAAAARAAQRLAVNHSAAGATVNAPAAAPLIVGEPRPLDRAVFPVGVRRIVLDPGHGGKDVGSVTPDGHYEKDITLDIALRLRDLLKAQQGIEVLMTRDKDERVLLSQRARFANDAKADLFLSIHLNWLEPATNRGVETFYLGPTEDPFLVQLAGRENRESGYSLADMRRLLDGIYLDLRQQESQQLAGSVQRALYGSLKQETPALRDRGIKPAPFLVLVTTEMPAVLAEVSCLSNQNEAALLATGEYRQSIAAALRAGLDAYTATLEDPDGNAQPDARAELPRTKQATGTTGSAK